MNIFGRFLGQSPLGRSAAAIIAALGYTPENQANKSVDGTFAANSDTLYPSQKAAKTYADTKQATSGKDATGGYAGLTLFKINFKNAANTFTSFFTNSNTAARTYTFQDRDGTIADNTDLALKIAILAVPYDLACQITGKPDASAIVLNFVAPRAFSLLASGQQGKAGVAATAETDFLVSVNSTLKATLRFAAAGTAISVVGGTQTNIAIGDVVEITAPVVPDATLADISFTLAATLL